MAKEIEVIKKQNNSLQSLLGDEIGILSAQEINCMKEGDLNKYAKKIAKKIVEKIHSISQDIQEAQDLNDQASKMETKGDFFSFIGIGKSQVDKLDEKQNLSNKAQTKQSKAILHMNDLIQESVKFTCCSMALSNRMVEYLGHFLLEGLKDKDGHLINLGSKATKMVEHMMTSIRQGIDRDIKVDSKMASISERLDEKDELDEQQSRDIKDLQEKVENKKQKIDQIEKELDEKDILDDRQDRDINDLKERILKLEGNKRLSIISFALATLSTILSIVAIALILVSKQLIF